MTDQTPDIDELRNSKRARAASVFVDPPGALTDALDKLDLLIEHTARLDAYPTELGHLLDHNQRRDFTEADYQEGNRE